MKTLLSMLLLLTTGLSAFAEAPTSELYSALTCRRTTFTGTPILTAYFAIKSGDPYPNYREIVAKYPGRYEEFFRRCRMETVDQPGLLIKMAVDEVSYPVPGGLRANDQACRMNAQCQSGVCDSVLSACRTLVRRTTDVLLRGP